jgi:hypothetical protein
MAATIQAADDTTKTDAATTAATGAGTRIEGMKCDGAVAKSGCAEGLRCHTGKSGTPTPEELA